MVDKIISILEKYDANEFASDDIIDECLQELSGSENPAIERLLRSQLTQLPVEKPYNEPPSEAHRLLTISSIIDELRTIPSNS